MMRGLNLGLGLLVLLACSSKESKRETVHDNDSQSPAWEQGITLPESTSAVDWVEPSITVVLTPRNVGIAGFKAPLFELDDTSSTLGAPGSVKRGGSRYLTPLGAFLKQQPSRGELGLRADGASLFAVLAEVVSTAADEGFGIVVLAVQSQSRTTQLKLRAPISARGEEDPLVTIVEGGVAFRTARGNMGTDCFGIGAGIAVPKLKSGEDDWESLRRCARTVQGGLPDSRARKVQIRGPSDLRLQRLVQVIDAVAGDTEWPVFTDAELRVDPTTAESEAMKAALNPPAPAPAPSSSGAKTPKGSVEIGRPTLTSGSAPSNMAAVVAAMAAGFRRCYQKGLRDDPTMAGSLTITIDVGPNGEVMGAKPSEAVGVSGVVQSCSAAVASSRTFDKPAGGNATLKVQIKLSPEKP